MSASATQGGHNNICHNSYNIATTKTLRRRGFQPNATHATHARYWNFSHQVLALAVFRSLRCVRSVRCVWVETAPNFTLDITVGQTRSHYF